MEFEWDSCTPLESFQICPILSDSNAIGFFPGMRHNMVHNSFRHHTGPGSVGHLLETGTVLDPMIHLVTQPIMNVTEEVKQTMSSGFQFSQHLGTLAAFWLMAYVGYTFVTDVFEPEVRSVWNGVQRGLKRARLN